MSAAVISNGIVLNPAENIPASHPRILYRNLFLEGTVTPSGEQSTEFVVENATEDPATYNFWRPDTMPGTITLVLPEAEVADYLFVAAHTLGTAQASLKLEYHDGSAWVEIIEVLRGNDDVFVSFFDEVMAAQWRVTVTGSTVPSLGVCMLGPALALPYGVTLQHAPVTLSSRTVIEPNISEGGQYLGRSIRRQGVGTSLTIRHLKERFIRDEFEPFIEHAKTRPWGWVWAPTAYETEVAYVWTQDDIAPAHDGMQDRLSVSFDVEGLTA